MGYTVALVKESNSYFTRVWLARKDKSKNNAPRETMQ